MESLSKTRRLIGQFLLILLLLGTVWAGWVQYHSPFIQALNHKEDTNLYIAIITQPAIMLAYNPQKRKAIVTIIKRHKTPTGPAENAEDIFKKAGLSAFPVRYYAPQTTKREEYWQLVRTNLTNWRYKPFIAAQVAWDYLQALHDKRTNLPFSEFVILALDSTKLELTDFTVKNVEEPTPKKGKTSSAEPDAILPPVEDRAPLAMEDRPLIVEILNASGVKGAALDLTQYLRNQNQKGLLQVDVLQYDNYPGDKQEQTRIIDYTGRRAQVKQLSTAIGVNSEIVSEKQGTAICDVRIIIGEDFKQPL